MQNIDAYVAQLQESFKKLIDTFKKYNIRHIPNIGENFIEIAFVLDDIYESVCREMRVSITSSVCVLRTTTHIHW